MIGRMMSGQQISQTPIEAKVQQIHKTISTYFDQVKLGKLVSSNEVEHYMTLKADERRKLNSREAAEASLILSQQAAYIQAEINRHKAVAEWCNEQIDGLISKIIHQYGTQYTSKELKRKIVILDSDTATKLETIRIEAMLRVNSLNYLPPYIQNVAHSYEILTRTYIGREMT